MLIKLVVKIYSLNLVSAYQGCGLIVLMTQGYLTAKKLRTTGLATVFLHEIGIIWEFLLAITLDVFV